MTIICDARWLVLCLSLFNLSFHFALSFFYHRIPSNLLNIFYMEYFFDMENCTDFVILNLQLEKKQQQQQQQDNNESK